MVKFNNGFMVIGDNADPITMRAFAKEAIMSITATNEFFPTQYWHV